MKSKIVFYIILKVNTSLEIAKTNLQKLTKSTLYNIKLQRKSVTHHCMYIVNSYVRL